jgi:hypothetical protein
VKRLASTQKMSSRARCALRWGGPGANTYPVNSQRTAQSPQRASAQGPLSRPAAQWQARVWRSNRRVLWAWVAKERQARGDLSRLCADSGLLEPAVVDVAGCTLRQN